MDSVKYSEDQVTFPYERERIRVGLDGLKVFFKFRYPVTWANGGERAFKQYVKHRREREVRERGSYAGGVTLDKVKDCFGQDSIWNKLLGTFDDNGVHYRVLRNGVTKFVKGLKENERV